MEECPELEKKIWGKTFFAVEGIPHGSPKLIHRGGFPQPPLGYYGRSAG